MPTESIKFQWEDQDIKRGGRGESGVAEKRDLFRSELFYDLVDRALERFVEASEEKTPPPEESVRPFGYENPYRPAEQDKPEERFLRRTGLPKMEKSLEFLFKKEWDKFIEPVVEHEEILAGIMTKHWESAGVKSRALKEHKEALDKAIEALRIIVPGIALMDAAKRNKILSQVYENYAEFIRHEAKRLEGFATKDARRGRYGSDLRSYLKTLDNGFLQQIVHEKEMKKRRNKEERAKKGKNPADDNVLG